MFGLIKFHMGFNEFHLELSFMYCVEKIATFEAAFEPPR